MSLSTTNSTCGVHTKGRIEEGKIERRVKIGRKVQVEDREGLAKDKTQRENH